MAAAPRPPAWLVAHLEPPSPFLQGDQVYRTVQPCHALAGMPDVEVVSGTWLSPVMQAAAAQAHVLVLCQTVDADLLPLLAARRAQGKRTLFEINDNFAAPLADSEVARFYANPQQRSGLLQLAAQSDGLQFCSPGLAARFGHLNAQQRIFPNQLWEVGEPAPRPRLGGPFVLGWGGSLGHQQDIAWIMPVLQAVLAAYPQVHLSIMAPAALHERFAWAPAPRLTLRPMGDMAAYQAFLRTLHLGLAPLLPTSFNACRSDVKYLEYASFGVASLCSSGEAYDSVLQNATRATGFDSLPSLRVQLDQLITRPDRCAALGAAAWDYARTRTEAKHAADRLAFLQPSPGTLGTSLHDLLCRGVTPHARPHARYVQLRFGALEASLYNGLLANAAGLDDLHAAQRLAPDFYLPALYLGSRLSAPAAALAQLRRACQLNPQSVAALHLLGSRLWDCQDAAAAVATWERAVTLAPLHAPSHEALGRACLSLGQGNAGRVHLQRALQANPYYRVPAARLAVAALEAGDASAAEGLLQETFRQSAGAWLEHYLMGDVHRRRRDWPAACRSLERALADCPSGGPVRPMLAQVYLAQGKLHAAQLLLNVGEPANSTA